MSDTTTRYLCTFDASGIQDYVFGSSRLRDNVGASVLVDKASRSWLFAVLDELFGERWTRSYEEFVIDDGQRAALLIAAGGNAQVVLRRFEDADALVAAHGRKVIEEAPELRVVSGIHPWAEGVSYGVADDAARGALARRKRGRLMDVVPELPGVIEVCAITGRPASARVPAPGGGRESVSAGILAKRKAAGRPKADLEGLGERVGEGSELAKVLQDIESRFAFSLELDALRGAKGESSYLGVVHIDVNGMGREFRRIAGQKDRADDVVITELSEFSKSTDRAVIEALAAGFRWILEKGLRKRDKSGRYCLFGQAPLHLDPSSRREAFPVRPVLVAGDDLTFVCEGSIALDLAAYVTRRLVTRLGELNVAAAQGGGARGALLGACAGVGLGLAHAPFWQLYRLAESACAEAKGRARKGGGSFLQWSFRAESGLEGEAKGAMASGAYAIDGEGVSAWPGFRREILRPVQAAAREHRGQLEALAGDLARGTDWVAMRRARWVDRGLAGFDTNLFAWADEHNSRDPRVSLEGGVTLSPYADAIALMDFVYREDADAEGTGTEEAAL